MATSRSSIRYGRIVYAWMEDRRGFRKLRPALALTPDELIGEPGELIVAAITTSFPQPPPINHVALPWHPNGNVVTRLRARSAVVVDWQAVIQADDIVGFGGDVPSHLMLEIEKRLKDVLGNP